MHVVQGCVGHMSRHPDASGGDDIVAVPHTDWELLETAAEEEVVVLAVESTLPHSVQEVGRNVKSLQVGEAFVLHRLSDDASAATDVQAD